MRRILLLIVLVIGPMAKAQDFGLLLGVHQTQAELTGAAKADSLANMQLRLPVIVIAVRSLVKSGREHVAHILAMALVPWLLYVAAVGGDHSAAGGWVAHSGADLWRTGLHQC